MKMMKQAISLTGEPPRFRRIKQTIRHGRLAAGYAVLLVLPFLATQFLDMDNKGLYLSALSLFNALAMMAFFIQFPLASRVKALPLFANIDWSMAKHKSVGQWLGVFFLLHPVFILAPRFIQSFDDGLTSLVEVLTAPTMLTGLIAWVTMIIWTLMAVFKNTIKMRYETWRLTHMLGFVAVAILATIHVTSVGSHGQFESQFNAIWWALCTASVTLVIYNHTVKKVVIKSQPFTLVDVTKVSSRDWQITLEKKDQGRFEFEAGQFVWMNSSQSVFNLNDHPFSIASCADDLPQFSMVIRELGDYTASLHTLVIGQDVYIDGPYGSMNLDDSKKADGIILIAGGAGIGPMLSLLRELACAKDTRPVRLIYGNSDFEQMVLQDEIAELQRTMTDFSQQLVCVHPTNKAQVSHGVIDQECISKVLKSAQADNWSVYLCGPEGMLEAVKTSLNDLEISPADIHYEKLSF